MSNTEKTSGPVKLIDDLINGFLTGKLDGRHIALIFVVGFALLSMYLSNREKTTPRNPEVEAAEIQFGTRPSTSEFDGSVRPVKEYILQTAKNPDSVVFEEWSKVFYDKKSGWVVRVTYRGQNSFGGNTREMNWFVIRNGAVVEVKQGDYYKRDYGSE
ncbi:MAG: hypothetical protein WCI95_05575 [bacterium]